MCTRRHQHTAFSDEFLSALEVLKYHQDYQTGLLTNARGTDNAFA